MPKLKPETIYPTRAEDDAINAGIAADKDNPEWTAEDFAQARPASQVLPPETYATLVARRTRGRPKAEETKVFTAIRLDAAILQAFKSDGRGWQTRINEALQEQLSVTTCLDARSGVYAKFPAPAADTTVHTNDDAFESILQTLKNRRMIVLYPVFGSHLIVKCRIAMDDGRAIWVFRSTKRIRPASQHEIEADRKDILRVLAARGLHCTWAN